MTITAAPAASVEAAPAQRSAGRFLMGASVVLLCLWVLGPIYLLLVNTLNTPEAVARWPKSLVPSFDLGSLRFFATYEGIPTALLNSVLVAAKNGLVVPTVPHAVDGALVPAPQLE